MSPDTTEEIMVATYRALCEHGYADLTMQDIADESDKSKAALHYHYDSKQALLEAFQEFIFERFFERVEAADDSTDHPAARLGAVLDAALSPPDADGLRDIQTALLEFRAQAPYVPAYRERLAESDARFRSLIEDILAAGVESGVFDADIEPAETAGFVATTLAGHQLRQVSLGQSPSETRRLLRRHVESSLVVDEEVAEQ